MIFREDFCLLISTNTNPPGFILRLYKGFLLNLAAHSSITPTSIRYSGMLKIEMGRELGTIFPSSPTTLPLNGKRYWKLVQLTSPMLSHLKPREKLRNPTDGCKTELFESTPKKN